MPAEIASDAAPRLVATVPLPVYADALAKIIAHLERQWREQLGDTPHRILLDVNFTQGKKLLIIDARQL